MAQQPHAATARKPEVEDETEEKSLPEKASVQPLAGVTSAAVRITNLYVHGGTQLDVLVTKSNGNLTIAPGMSGIVLLSDTITAIATVAGQNSGGTARTPVDIG